MHLRSLFISLCLFTGLQFVQIPLLHAAETRTDYAVDIVVFEDSQGRYLNSEQWPLPPVAEAQPATTTTTTAAAVKPVSVPAPTALAPVPTTATTPATEAGTGTNNDKNTDTNQSSTTEPNAASNPDIHAIDPGKYDLLNNDVKRLIASPRYHILVRKTWIQPGLDSKNAVNIDMNSANDPESAGAVGSLTGSVKIVLERYLHLYTNLVYHLPITAATPAGDSATPPSPQIQDFVIKQHRRMRSKVLHYIDHPLVGILIKIVPVETNIEATP